MRLFVAKRTIYYCYCCKKKISAGEEALKELVRYDAGWQRGQQTVNWHRRCIEEILEKPPVDSAEVIEGVLNGIAAKMGAGEWSLSLD
jgi:hypothetical protein